MPVVIAPEDFSRWLDCDLVSAEEASALLKPAAEDYFVVEPTVIERTPRPQPPRPAQPEPAAERQSGDHARCFRGYSPAYTLAWRKHRRAGYIAQSANIFL